MDMEGIRTENWNGHPIRFVERDGEWWAVAADFESRIADDQYKGKPGAFSNG
jgi:prophage antirepressor-like protein